jgi:hypothetical protein
MRLLLWLRRASDLCPLKLNHWPFAFIIIVRREPRYSRLLEIFIIRSPLVVIELAIKPRQSPIASPVFSHGYTS